MREQIKKGQTGRVFRESNRNEAREQNQRASVKEREREREREIERERQRGREREAGREWAERKVSRMSE